MQFDFGKNLKESGEIVLSVSEYLERLNLALGGEAGFVEGEVMGFKASPQWVFFSLKDENKDAVLSCGLLAHEYRRIGVRIEDGMRIKIFGNPRITAKSGRFGMWVKSIEAVGEGSLKKAYELLFKQLTQEGLFARKRALPEFISRIAVISSRDGVVLQDLRKNLRKLNFRISFMHTSVEGAGAVAGILRALQYFARLHQGSAGQTKSYDDYDCIVLIRGGGSLESMQAFNNEEVVRAIYASPIPVIAGIGHDVDVPLSALVSDAMASTPTGVAHMINSTWDALTLGLPQFEMQIVNGMNTAIYRWKNRVDLLQSKMLNYFTQLFRAFDLVAGQLSRACERVGERISAIREYLHRTERLLTLSDPIRNLKLGYSLTYVAGRVLKSKKDAKIGDTLETRVSDGSIKSKVQ